MNSKSSFENHWYCEGHHEKHEEIKFVANIIAYSYDCHEDVHNKDHVCTSDRYKMEFSF